MNKLLLFLCVCSLVNGCIVTKHFNKPSFLVECLFIKGSSKDCDEIISYLYQGNPITSIPEEYKQNLTCFDFIPPFILSFDYISTNSCLYGKIEYPNKIDAENILSMNYYQLGTCVITKINNHNEGEFSLDFNVINRSFPIHWGKVLFHSRLFYSPNYEIFDFSFSQPMDSAYIYSIPRRDQTVKLEPKSGKIFPYDIHDLESYVKQLPRPAPRFTDDVKLFYLKVKQNN